MSPDINKQRIELWSKIINNTSREGMLHMAMRHMAHNLTEMVERPFEIDNLRIETLPMSQLGIYTDNPEAETVGVYLLIGDELLGEAVLILIL